MGCTGKFVYVCRHKTTRAVQQKSAPQNEKWKIADITPAANNIPMTRCQVKADAGFGNAWTRPEEDTDGPAAHLSPLLPTHSRRSSSTCRQCLGPKSSG